MEGILTLPVNVPLLDAVVQAFSDANNPQRATAEAVLVRFRQLPTAWTQVNAVLAASKLQQTRYLALQVLEDLIKFKWRALPASQREEIRSDLVTKIITLSRDEAILRSEALLIKKMNVLLVGILKQDWPANWPSFIPDIVAASKTSEVLCENNVTILRLLSEEVFDFSRDSMTSERAAALKLGLQSELQQIFELLMFVLDASSRGSLVTATLDCLQRYVTWIPEIYLFETAMLEVLCMKFLPLPEFRVPTLQVLTEVSALAKPQYNKVFELLYIGVMGQLVRVLPADNVKSAFAAAEASGDEASMLYVRHLALFLTTFLAEHGELLETESYKEALLSGLNYLVQASDVGDAEIFKICVEFWLQCASSLYETEAAYNPSLPSLAAVAAASGTALAAIAGTHPPALQPLAGGAGGGAGAAAPANPRKPLYAEVLSRVREVLIRHMARPEEVLIEKDDSGEYVRETQKDTDAIALYKVMRDTLVFLTHLDPRNSEELMLEKLTKQVNGEEWGYDVLNMLCWAIGSISGTMGEQEEKNFLVTVIKDLLLLCETKRGKANKAVIASNIMYVVGQYPRFLRAHWKFLRTVVVKLFEFMHEKHPGVQDMAVDTFLKIAQKTKRRFVQVQFGETRPFVDELCAQLPSIVSDLEPHQVHTFYEAAGHMVSAFADEAAREAAVERLMAGPNAAWRRLLAVAADDLERLKSPETLKELQRVLRTNVFACRSVGAAFAKQIGALFVDMMNVYRALSGFIAAALAAHGAGVMATHALKCMTNVKKEALALVATYVAAAESPAFVAEHFIPPLLEPVLGDYAAAAPAAREVEVLTLMTEVVSRLRASVLPEAPRILATVFEPTLSMITASAAADEFPEHRLAFFKLLEAINSHCFAALAAIPPAQLAAVLAAVAWAFKHTARETGETGLHILMQLLTNVAAAGDDVAQPFFQQFALGLVTDLLGVLTDRLHKAHFKLHAELLRHLFHLVDAGAVTAPLWTAPAAAASPVGAAFAAQLAAVAAQASAAGTALPSAAACNRQFLRAAVLAWLSATEENLLPSQAEAFVDGLFVYTNDLQAYKTHLRDFLIEVLEFKSKDAAGDLYAEERAEARRNEEARRRAVPGLVLPYDALSADYKAVDDDDDDGDL